MMGSILGGGNMYIQWVSRFCTVDCQPLVKNYQLSYMGPGVKTAIFRGVR